MSRNAIALLRIGLTLCATLGAATLAVSARDFGYRVAWMVGTIFLAFMLGIRTTEFPP